MSFSGLRNARSAYVPLIATCSVILDAREERQTMGEWYLPSSMAPHSMLAVNTGRTIIVRHQTRTPASADIGDVMCA